MGYVNYHEAEAVVVSAKIYIKKVILTLPENHDGLPRG